MTESLERVDHAHHDLPMVPEPGPERLRFAAQRIALTRKARGVGDRGLAAEIIVDSLRAGLWRHRRLWSELVSLMQGPEDYNLVRSLWWESPAACHRSRPIVRTIARAASVAGEHGEARTLLRKAILQEARRRARFKSKLSRVKTTVTSRLRSKGSSTASFDARASSALDDLSHEIDLLGVRAFLISGTLLGYVREATFISWDKDIDLGFLTSEIDPADLEKAFDRSSMFNVRRLDFNADRLRINHHDGIMIDIFPHYRGDDGLIWHDGSATRWWNTQFELTTVDFLGRPHFVPDPPTRYLDENYGDWRVPEPNFDARIDAPNVEITDKELFDTLLYFSLLDAITKDHRAKRERYTNLLRDLGEGSWLEQVSPRSSRTGT